MGSSHGYVSYGAKQLEKGRLELAYAVEYELPGQCLSCLEPEAVRIDWQASSHLERYEPPIRKTSVSSYSLQLSLPYCAAHAGACEEKMEKLKRTFGPVPGFPAATVPGFSALIHGEFVGERVQGVRAELRFDEGAYASRVAAGNIERIMEVLVSEEFGIGTRVRAAHVLGEIGDSRAVGVLEAAARANLHGPPADLGGVANVEVAHLSFGRELGRLGEPALEPLARMLRDDEAEVRRAAVGGLGSAGLPGARDLLIDCLQSDQEPEVKASAAYALAHYASEPTARGALEAASRDPSRKVRRQAKWALKHGPKWAKQSVPG